MQSRCQLQTSIAERILFISIQQTCLCRPDTHTHTHTHTPQQTMLNVFWAMYKVVLDRVRHFRPIPIHRFFAVNRIRYRYDTDFFIRFKSGRGTAWLTDQRLQTPPPQRCAADPLQRGGGCLWSVVDSQTQQLSVKFNITNTTVMSVLNS